MDHFCKEALRQLGESVKASGEIIATVSQWPDDIKHARSQHIYGAARNVVNVTDAVAVVAAL